MGSQFFGNKHSNKTSDKNASSKMKSKGGQKNTSSTTVKKAGRGK